MKNRQGLFVAKMFSSQGKVIRQTKEFFESVFEGHCDVEGGSFIEYFMAKETECLDLFLQCKFTQMV